MVHSEVSTQVVHTQTRSDAGEHLVFVRSDGGFEIYSWEGFAISVEASGQIPGEEGLLIAS